VIEAFALSFGVILLAELGDKSQLMTIAFAARYPWWVVLAAISAAILLVSGISVALGSAVALVLPAGVLPVLAGVAFLVFAAWTLRGDGDDDEAEDRPARSNGQAFLAIGAAFFVAELGDKTMLATLTIAATAEPIGTWLGASAGMITANLLAILVGAVLGAKLPARAIRLLAAAAFAIFGVVLVLEGVGVL
jgi:putative Ca2+/H+ antiporter (TMEM165/GDT1 family)